MRTPHVLLLAGASQACVGVLVALSHARRDVPVVAARVDAVLITTGLALVALAVVLAILPAFTGREVAGRRYVWTVPLVLLAADLLAVLTHFLPPEVLALPLLLALPLVGLRGPTIPDHAPPLDPGRPHRIGDRAAVAALLAGVAGLLAGVLLLAFAPRGLPVAGLVVLLAALPVLALGVLAFLLPRLTAASFPGATLLYAALGVLALCVTGLVIAFAIPGVGGFRYAAGGILLAELLALVAFVRIDLPPAAQGRLAHARPLLRAAAALAPLAGFVLLLSVLADRPGDLIPLAAYAHLVLGALLLAAALHLAAPFLRISPGGPPLQTRLGAALLVAGLFLLAPSLQYPYSAFPGALALALGALFVAAPLAVQGPRVPDRKSKR